MHGGSGAGPGHCGLAQAIDWAAAAASGSLPKTFTSFLPKTFTSPERTLSAQNWLALPVAGACRS